MNFFSKLFNRREMPKVDHLSNIIQYDDMGYPLMLCLMTDGSQMWIDVPVEYAKINIEKGNFQVLKWSD